MEFRWKWKDLFNLIFKGDKIEKVLIQLINDYFAFSGMWK
jgi:hypothetical protein